ncbi:hypothetical protein FE257_007144 [Aspergillus nanangensis]|uniref:Carrier domain-containing protein n=1 Tax=Aspergillus nanangensis TaxID=2582783 RepID=A0AAD4CNB0_ASPNN|nr:hypothetical protein FE257_007144 [Aspergillus nanangensis]
MSIPIEKEVEIVDWRAADPENPIHWPNSRKWLVTVAALFTTFICMMNGTMITVAHEILDEQFNISEASFAHSYWLVTTWTLGGGLFTLVILPLMEDFGVRPAFLSMHTMFVAFIIPQALASNFATLLVSRFFAGGCVTVLACSSVNVIDNVWETEQDRLIPVGLWIVAYLCGTSVGPVLGGAILNLSWRWISYMQLIWNGVLLVLNFLTMKESRGSVLLQRRAEKLRAQGRSVYTQHELEAQHRQEYSQPKSAFTSGISLVMTSVQRPFKMLFTEYVLFFCALWSAFGLGIIYLFTQSVEQVYATLYDWTPVQAGYMQAAVVIGEIIGAGVHFLAGYLDGKSDSTSPEERLYSSVGGAVFGLTGGMLVYGWTSYSYIPWPIPAIGLALVGAGSVVTLAGSNSYIVDVYNNYAGSAIAGLALVESLTTAFLPLATLMQAKMVDAISHPIPTRDARLSMLLEKNSMISEAKEIREPDDDFSSVQNLSQLLAQASATKGGSTFYIDGKEGPQVHRESYTDLREDAMDKASLLSTIPGISTTSVILLHFDTQREIIQWFWAATLLGLLPAISTPFVQDKTWRKKHLLHLHELLEKPMILTSEGLVPSFLGIEELQLHSVKSLKEKTDTSGGYTVSMKGTEKKADDAAVLMLTSGSTGSAKAVPLGHGQLLAAMRGKRSLHNTEARDIFLNWVGLDHVASLCEIHLHALSLGSEQVHVPAPMLFLDPLQFIRLLDVHRVSYTFAPNFFLTQVRDTLIAHGSDIDADLSCLKRIISGGEANLVTTCDSLTRELRRLGMRDGVVSPGFGMTETCAGSIYAQACPSYDVARGHEFASLGTCIPGIEMRVVRLDGTGGLAATGEVGELQLFGDVLFSGYFNNPTATRDAFTPSGWFITGDWGWLDENGHLNLAGRGKDTVNINGVKWNAAEIEAAIEEEHIPGILPSFTAVFSCRDPGSPTEEIAIVYCPTFAVDELKARVETDVAVSKVIALLTGRNPRHSMPLFERTPDMSSLGKISRTRIRDAFNNGEYSAMEADHIRAIRNYRQAVWRPVTTDTEKNIQRILVELLGIHADDIGVDTSIFDLGITSFNLILLRAMIEGVADSSIELPISILMTRPAVGDIAASVDQLLSQPPEYNPVVPLHTKGSQTPLFLIHPGSGDILVFIALATQFPNRPVYALRTRGYNINETVFSIMQEAAQTYVFHIRKTQPQGPYAVAGYSLGSTLAFEVGKLLEAQGQEVRFLASIDYPPHISQYVRGLNWVDVLFHISFFLELIDQEIMDRAMTHLHMHPMSCQAALEYVLSISDQQRVRSLALTPRVLSRICDIGENFRVQGETYEPVGSVAHLDVFVADPPGYAAADRRDWVENKLGRWRDFVRSDVEFYECPGIHARMLNPEMIPGFAKRFKLAMKRRGV